MRRLLDRPPGLREALVCFRPADRPAAHRSAQRRQRQLVELGDDVVEPVGEVFEVSHRPSLAPPRAEPRSAARSLSLGTVTPLDAIPGLVAALRDAHDDGVLRAVASRRAQLTQLRRLLVENEASIVAVLAADLRRPSMETVASEVAVTVSEVDFALRHLGAWTAPRRVRLRPTLRPGHAAVVPEPLGVVLILSPWNYPFQLTFAPLVGALAAGNAAVLKPSELSPASSALIAALAERYLDQRVVRVVTGGAEQATALLDERFDHIFFTGGREVARTVMTAAARRLTPLTLELGGKCPAIVAADADIDVAARRIAWGRFINAGQTCVAPDYVLVEATVEDALAGALRRAVGDFYGGDPRHSPDFGRIVNAEHHRRLVELLDAGGYAEVTTGGDHDAAALYVAPTVLRGVAANAAVMTSEIFGPILPVLAVPDIGAAIEFVNRRDRPLAVYAFTRSAATRERIVEQTSSGGVCVNHVALHLAVPTLPFGGVGASGFGAYHGEAGFRTFSHVKAVLDRSGRLDPPVLYPPYSRWKAAVVRALGRTRA